MPNLTSSQWRKVSLIPLAAFVLAYKVGPGFDQHPGLFWVINLLCLGSAFYCLRRGMDVDRKPVKPQGADDTSVM